ncbi:MAG: histidine acid phosphatase [Bacteroidaceae bacterium]|nr:histidine acid phosphatase [Bacteroidaceae bacterium]
MKKSVLLILLLSFVLGLSAQTAKEEIFADVYRSGSNYYAYQIPEETSLTAAPAGYKPFYISTYQRHGSRFLTGKNDYSTPLNTLQEADKAGKLTPLGRKVMADLDSLNCMSRGRIGELTPLGAIQHTGVAKRMFTNFPDVFEGKALIDARSTIVIRCILSMMDECMQFKAMNPEIEVKNDASMHDMYYMNYDDSDILKLRELPQVKAAIKKFEKNHVHPERLMSSLFTDHAYVKQNINADQLMEKIFRVTGNMQSHKYQTTLNLYPIFTRQECYDLWCGNNLYWYINYGPSPLTKGAMPYLESNLLKNILDTADTCVVSRSHGATLRFGHDSCILPLAVLMDLGGFGKVINNPEDLADQWRNYKIIMMASNIQLIFYRNPESNDILVKALLNEHEVSMPVKTDIAPYYHWKDVEAYYRQKLATFKKTFYSKSHI